MRAASGRPEYIERYEVLNIINDAIEHNALSYEGCVNEIIERIAKFPAADVRPVVRGKWESHGEGFKWVFVCSACGYVDGYPMNDRMNFCPNCGADMREGE